MTEMRRESYNDQARLLAAYKSFLEEQVRVITARMVMAKRLKPGG
jgi:hypothetical protein